MPRFAGVLLLALSATLTQAGWPDPDLLFATVGLDWRTTSGDLYRELDAMYLPLEPHFRTGVLILPQLAVGAELSFIGTFPKQGNIFTNTPVVNFSPTVILASDAVQHMFRPYAGVAAGMTYLGAGLTGLRGKALAGVHIAPPIPVSFAVEAGGFTDVSHAYYYFGPKKRWKWLRSNTLFAGVRVVFSGR